MRNPAMYKLQYLPAARSGIQIAINDIAGELKIPKAAPSLMEKLEQHILQLKEFPYAHPLYPSPMRLLSETRFIPVEKYLVFYTVLEPGHIVEIRRVLYSKTDLRKQTV